MPNAGKFKLPLADPKSEASPDREVAQRDPIKLRFDILDPRFLSFMAMIADYGARKYGENNWKKSPLIGDKSPINHAIKHLMAYQMRESYDHPEIGNSHWLHLVAVAFNCMMSFYHDYGKDQE